jgi:DNA mismatch repair protein MutS2
MNEKTLGLLEFEAVRARVAGAAGSEEAARRLRAAAPLTSPGETAALKDLVSQGLDRLCSGDEEPGGGLPDISALLPKLAVEGASLEVEEAFALGLFTERGEALRKWLSPPGSPAPVPPRPEASSLAARCAALPDCSAVGREVFRVLDKNGALRDLPEFREIKRRLRRLAGELEALTARYTGNEETRRMLQSALPSQRDGRVVLAVKANFRGRIKGIVHEVSATGQTLFVEPEEVVEKNNDILIEERRLDAEIRRVLREMTGRIAAGREALGEFHEGIIGLDCILARSRYARDTRGCFAASPPAEEAAPLVLKQARHPLLGSRAVPIDIQMSGGVRAVIITGPNTGGKTVALKTMGLFALMNQFGLALPAEAASLPVFDGIYADIGDEQSLSQSLSTFSAHMTNIAAIAAAATASSLVLLDELGAGTDPEEGGALAMAILDHLIEKGCRLVLTTHHGILKNYGYTRGGVENASVDFDSRTLSPTYRIVMGVPGESRAVDIAARNGVPPDIISRARGYLAEERSDVSALITGLKRKHQELDAAEEARRAETLRLREERRQADLKELRLRQREIGLKTEGVGSLRRLLAESRKTLENLVREIKEGELSREKTLGVKEFLRDLEKAAAAEGSALEGDMEALAGEERRFEREAAAGEPAGKGPGETGPAPIGPGTEVLAGEFKRRGRVIRGDKRGAWVVEIGSLRMTLDEKDLIPLAPSREERKPLIAPADLAGTTQAQFELSLRGLRLEEALELLQRQIDAAVLSGLREFSVVHGKGDGILQRGVHQYLKTQSAVADYYFSRPELGGFGRTEVILKL